MTTFRALTRNLVALTGAALPAAIAVGALQQVVSPIEWSRGIAASPSGGERILGVLFWYVVLAWPLLIGGSAHQLVIFFLSRLVSQKALRASAILTSPMVLAGFFVVGGAGDTLFAARDVLPILALLVIYGVLIWRSPAGEP